MFWKDRETPNKLAANQIKGFHDGLAELAQQKMCTFSF